MINPNIYDDIAGILNTKDSNFDKIGQLGNKSDWDISTNEPNQGDKNELEKWKKAFSGQTPQQVDEIIQDYRIKTRQLFEHIQKHTKGIKT